MKNPLILALALFGLSQMALAQTSEEQGSSHYELVPDLPMLIAADTQENNLKMSTSDPSAESITTFREPLFTKNKFHQFLGLGSLGLVGLAILAPKEEGKSPHHYLALGATGFGAAAVASGLVVHLNDIHISRGFKDPDNLHALLGLLATAGFAAAVSAAPGEAHPAFGIVGATSMLLAVKMTW